MRGLIENSRVLVTGGAGFIGSGLCEALLKQGNEVVCLDSFITGKRENISEFLQSKRFRLMEGDIRDLSLCMKAADGIDYVLHQAALGSVTRSINDPVTTNDINVNGFLNVLFAAKERKVRRFVYATSSSVYGDHPGLPKTEDNIGAPLSPYAVSKNVNEMYAAVFSRLYEIETIGLRYFNVFGKRQDPDGAYAAAIPKFIKAFISGESPVIDGDGTQTRDFTYVDNVIQANQRAALTGRKEALNTVYNVAYGVNNNLNELVKILQEMLVAFDPSIAGIKVKYGPERKGDIKNSLASVEKAKKMLGYQPKDDLKTGLKKAIGWYWKCLRPHQAAGLR